MLRFAANLSTLFQDTPLEARFQRAAAAGFRGVELQFPYAIPAARLADLLSDNGLELVLFNAPAGNLAAGDRGLVLEGGERLEAAVQNALEYVEATGCPRVHLMLGNGRAGHRPTMIRAAATIAGIASRFAAHGAQVLLEALNTTDQPNYFLSSLKVAGVLRQRIGAANVLLQFDAYHAARSGHDPLALLQAHIAHVGHIQLADPTDRGEPDSPLMQSFLAAVDAMGWPDFVGCEYLPRGDTIAGLGWAAPFGLRSVEDAAGALHV